MHPHRANPVFLYEEADEPVWCHYLAYRLREPENCYSVIQFCCEDSDFAVLTGPSADKHPYRELGMKPLRFYWLADSSKSNGYDLYHFVGAFPYRTIEVVCMTYAILAPQVLGRSSRSVLFDVLRQQSEPGWESEQNHRDTQ